jgi:hypothetical protein
MNVVGQMEFVGQVEKLFYFMDGRQTSGGTFKQQKLDFIEVRGQHFDILYIPLRIYEGCGSYLERE